MSNGEIDDFMSKFSIRVIGEHEKLGDFEKIHINDMLKNFAQSFIGQFSEGVIIADIKHKTGQYNKGKYRGVPLAFVRIRFSTDKGLFVARKENWGASTALNDCLHILTQQIRTQFSRQKERERNTSLKEEVFEAKT